MSVFLLFSSALLLLVSDVSCRSYYQLEGGTTSLFSPTDNVIELTDNNLTSTFFGNDKFWVVNFYAHWCGHCQSFAPSWKKLAAFFNGGFNCKETFK